MKAKALITAAPGGHTGYAIAIAHYLKELGVEPTFIVASYDDLAPKRLRRLGRVIRITMPRRVGEAFYKSIPRWPLAFIQSAKITKKDYEVLVSCGANLSVPPALVAKLRGIPIVNIEDIARFTVPGRTPKILHRLADKTLVHWPEQLKLLPGAHVVGPIYEPPLYKPRNEGYILVTAGTMGHKALFDALSRLNLKNIVMQTGKIDPSHYKILHPEWKVFRFDPEFERWIAGAEVVITHFPGMTSATAALAYRKPVILVAAHHIKLAAPIRDGPLYAEKIGAVYVDEVTPRRLLEAIERARGMEPKRYDNGAKEAARLIKQLLEERDG